MLTIKPTPWKMRFLALGLLVFTSWLTACSSGKRISFYTGVDYITFAKGQVYVAPRDMTLATESVIQAKDQQILDLQKVCRELQRRLDLLESH